MTVRAFDAWIASKAGAMTYLTTVSESDIADALEALGLTMPGLNYLETGERVMFEIVRAQGDDL